MFTKNRDRVARPIVIISNFARSASRRKKGKKNKKNSRLKKRNDEQVDGGNWRKKFPPVVKQAIKGDRGGDDL